MKPPLDPTPVPQDPRSRPITAASPDGGYVYVQDGQGTIRVLPDGPHRHPRVLGGGKPALYAGDLTIEHGRIRDVTNLSGTFQCDDADGLMAVAAELERLGFEIDPGAVRFFPQEEVGPACSGEARPMQILILEDKRERQHHMGDCLRDRFPQYPARFFDSAPAMISHLHETGLDDALLVALDHDLELLLAEGRMIDPGTGRDVADYLAMQQPACPIVIHTTNSPAAVGMQTVLEDAGWTVSRVVPFDGHAWIGSIWLRVVRDAIVSGVAPIVPTRH